MNNTEIKPTMGTVLIIDDDKEVIQSFALMLRLESYTALTADNAEDGLRETERHHPDAILLDLRMPLMDGLAFLRRLRAGETQRAIPVVIVTGDYFVDETIGADVRELGAEIHFKPLWLEDLIGLVRRLLSGREDSPLGR